MSAWGEEDESRTVMPVLVFCYLFRPLCGAYYMLSNCFLQVSLSPEVSAPSALPFGRATSRHHHARWSPRRAGARGRSAVGAPGGYRAYTRLTRTHADNTLRAATARLSRADEPVATSCPGRQSDVIGLRFDESFQRLASRQALPRVRVVTVPRTYLEPFPRSAVAMASESTSRERKQGRPAAIGGSCRCVALPGVMRRPTSGHTKPWPQRGEHGQRACTLTRSSGSSSTYLGRPTGAPPVSRPGSSWRRTAALAPSKARRTPRGRAPLSARPRARALPKTAAAPE